MNAENIRIIKHGNGKDWRRFSCLFCGCVFGTDEYKPHVIHHLKENGEYDNAISIVYECPDCGATVTEYPARGNRVKI